MINEFNKLYYFDNTFKFKKLIKYTNNFLKTEYKLFTNKK